MKFTQEEIEILNVILLPLEIAKIAQAEMRKLSPQHDTFDSNAWSETSQGYDFWKRIHDGDFEEFFNTLKEETKQTLNFSPNFKNAENMQNTSKHQSLISQLHNLEETGKVRVVVKRVFETHYKTKDLDKALEKQVVMNLIHSIPAMEISHSVSDDEDEENDGFVYPVIKAQDVVVSQPRVMIDIQIIGLDTPETIQKKINIARAKLDELDKIDSIIAMRESDNLLDCMDGYFGEGHRIAIRESRN